MHEKTFALVIGVSQYDQLENLPAAESDAIHFARALVNWGIEEENVHLLINNKATEKAVIMILEELSLLDQPFKFLFYYSGHGHRSNPPNPKSYLLFHKSRLELERFLRKINELPSTQNHLFIDACELRINSLINPELQKELEKRPGPRKSLFCILSSGIEKSYEDTVEEFGYFTESLLKNLSLFREGNHSPDVLINAIHCDMKNQGLAIPEIYNIGTLKIDFLPPLSKGLSRKPLIGKIQDLLVQFPRKILCLIGEKGIGKTTLCEQLTSQKCRTFLFESLTSLEDLPPYSLIILDPINVRKPSTLNNLMQVLLEARAQFILVTTKSFKSLLEPSYQKKIHEIEVPPLDFDATEDLISQSERDFPQNNELIFLATKGNPTKIKSILIDSSQNYFSEKEKNDIKKAIAAITASGMYLDEELFCEVCHLNPSTLSLMEEMGLIAKSKDSWIPDECLLDIAEAEELDINHQMALEYWRREIEENPQEIQSFKSMILSIKCFGYDSKLDQYLQRSFEGLSEKKDEHLCFFEDGAEIFIAKKKISKASLYLADLFLEMGLLERAEQLLKLQHGDDHLLVEARIKYCQLLWRKGDFQHSYVLLEDLLPSISSPSEKNLLFLNRGIASFFSGAWKKAKADFQTVIKHADSPYFSGMGLCMLGSTLGFEGVYIEDGIKNLEMGIRTLTQSGDLSSAWVGWNNLGEIYWMIGKYRLSDSCLQKAQKVATNPSTLIETQRNLLQLYLRSKGPDSKEIIEIIDKIEATDYKQIETYEIIQLHNTLGLIYLLRGDWKKARQLINKNIPLTAKNSFLHIFTLTNMAFLFRIHGLSDKSNYYFSKALDCAKGKKNELAAALAHRDLEMVNRHLPAVDSYSI